MTPAEAVETLDRFLVETGENVTLRRIVGTGPSATNQDITVRAHIRSFKEDELVAGISQDDRLLIMSPTEITTASWPGGVFSLPRKGDKVVVSGAPCNAEFVKPIRMAGSGWRNDA